MGSITLWGRSSAFNVQKVLWLLAELDLDFEHRIVGGGHGGLCTPEFLALNPHGRIPVLQDDEAVVWESHAILRYLAAAYGGERFWSASPAVRAQVDTWMDWAQTTLQPDFMRLFWGYYRTPASQRDPAHVQLAVQACKRHFCLLDAQLRQRRYLAGDSFTLADVPAGTALFRYFEMGLQVQRPTYVMEWYARLAERPSYRRHVMTSFDELRERLMY